MCFHIGPIVSDKHAPRSSPLACMSLNCSAVSWYSFCVFAVILAIASPVFYFYFIKQMFTSQINNEKDSPIYPFYFRFDFEIENRFWLAAAGLLLNAQDALYDCIRPYIAK